jgi:hypothetical protein
LASLASMAGSLQSAFCALGIDPIGLDQAMGCPRLTHRVRGRVGALSILPALWGEAVGGATKFSDRLDFDLDANLDDLSCGNTEISGRAFSVALHEGEQGFAPNPHPRYMRGRDDC